VAPIGPACQPVGELGEKSLGFSPIAESSTAQFLVLPLISWCGVTFNGVEFHMNMGGTVFFSVSSQNQRTIFVWVMLQV